MITELSKLLEDSVVETLEEKVSIAFSGGVDSSIIATIAKRFCEVELFTAGIEKADDIGAAREIAKKLNLPLFECVMDKEEIIKTYENCYKICPLEFLKLELLVPIYKIAEEAQKRKNKVMLFGSGSEELFVGYERYYTYAKEGKNLDEILKQEYKELQKKEITWISKICRKFDIEARFPFYNNKLASYVFNIPLEIRMEDKELKKGVLREAAAFLDVPEAAVKRRKKALQYGSGVHKVLLAYLSKKDGPRGI